MQPHNWETPPPLGDGTDRSVHCQLAGLSTGVTAGRLDSADAGFHSGRTQALGRRGSRPTGRPRCGTPGPKEESPLLALTRSLSLLHSQRRQLRVALALAPRVGAAQPAARAASLSGRCSPAGHQHHGRARPARGFDPSDLLLLVRFRSGQVSGQVRYITRPKSRTMRATRQLMLPPSTVS